MARVLVTGASGHIGNNVVRELLEGGHHPVAFVRPTSSRAGLDDLDVEIVTGDVLDRASLEAAMEGVEVVIHCAANFAIWAKDPDEILRPAVEGTRNVFEAAAARGVRRIVYTSSSAAVGASPSPDRVLSEDDWFDDPAVPYYRAKVESERLAYELSEATDVEVVVLCPGMVLGGHDYRCTPSMRPLLDIANGKGPTIDGGAGVISVRDVARAHVLAMDRGESGARYIVSGDNCTLVEIGRMIAELTGKQAKHLSLPRWAFMTVASLMEFGSTLSGKAPPMTRAAVRDLLGKYAWYDTSRARRSLGLRPAPADRVVRETMTWFLDSGWLEPEVAERVRENLGDPGLPARAA